jgi:hypothetical protein
MKLVYNFEIEKRIDVVWEEKLEKYLDEIGM